MFFNLSGNQSSRQKERNIFSAPTTPKARRSQLNSQKSNRLRLSNEELSTSQTGNQNNKTKGAKFKKIICT